MTTESRSLTCPVCGHVESITVRVWGDSDGDDGKGVLNHKNCPRCKGWSEASPLLYQTLLSHYERAQKIKGETEERMHKAYNLYISRWAISSVVCDIDKRDERLKTFQKERKHCNKIVDETGERRDNKWVLGKAVEAAVSCYIEQLEKEENRRNKFIQNIS